MRIIAVLWGKLTPIFDKMTKLIMQGNDNIMSTGS